MVASKPDAEPAAQTQASEPNTQSNLTFYKAVQEERTIRNRRRKSAASGGLKTPATEVLLGAVRQQRPAERSADTAPRTPPVSHSAPVTGPGTIVVQIAAVSREDDAVALAGALRKKDYNVFVVNNPATNDKFYHVQVGPFATMPEADAMKAKLIAEGYNPIVKK